MKGAWGWGRIWKEVKVLKERKLEGRWKVRKRGEEKQGIGSGGEEEEQGGKGSLREGGGDARRRKRERGEKEREEERKDISRRQG